MRGPRPQAYPIRAQRNKKKWEGLAPHAQQQNYLAVIQNVRTRRGAHRAPANPHRTPYRAVGGGVPDAPSPQAYFNPSLATP